MPKPIHDFTGRRVGTFLVLERLKAKQNVVHYRCRCDCGQEDLLTTQFLAGNGSGSVPLCRFCSTKMKTVFDNLAAKRFLSAPRPRIEGDLTMGKLVAKHRRKTPAFKPYRVRIQGDWG